MRVPVAAGASILVPGPVMSIESQRGARAPAATVRGLALVDALVLLAVGSRLHAAVDGDALRAAAAFAARDLLPGASVRCDVVDEAADRTSRHEVVRVTARAAAPRLALTVVRHPAPVGARDVAVTTVLADQLGSAWELVRLRRTSAQRGTGRLATLTQREREVLALVARGATNAEAGARLGIGARTVEKHLEHVAVKLGARGRTAASAVYLGALATAR